MSYMITIKFPAVSAATAEGVARDEQADRVKRIIEDGQQYGCTHQLSPEAPDGALRVGDEWPDEATFRRFYEGQQDTPKLPEARGASRDLAPEVTPRRILDTP